MKAPKTIFDTPHTSTTSYITHSWRRETYFLQIFLPDCLFCFLRIYLLDITCWFCSYWKKIVVSIVKSSFTFCHSSLLITSASKSPDECKNKNVHIHSSFNQSASIFFQQIFDFASKKSFKHQFLAFFQQLSHSVWRLSFLTVFQTFFTVTFTGPKLPA